MICEVNVKKNYIICECFCLGINVYMGKKCECKLLWSIVNNEVKKIVGIKNNIVVIVMICICIMI